MILKLTKTELRLQQLKLQQLRKYLPTLQLKKALLQIEVNQVSAFIALLQCQFVAQEEKIARYSALFSEKNASDLFAAVKIQEVKKEIENIAGIDVPIFRDLVFEKSSFFLFDSPVWIELGIFDVKELMVVREKMRLAHQKRQALEKELRDVSIRVNLFEKIMIPRALGNIKKIKIFLGDQQLTAVSQAKVAKKKILLRKKKSV